MIAHMKVNLTAHAHRNPFSFFINVFKKIQFKFCLDTLKHLISPNCVSDVK